MKRRDDNRGHHPGRDIGKRRGAGRDISQRRGAGRDISQRRGDRRSGDWRTVAGLLAALPVAAAERPADDAAQQRLADFWARHFGPAAARSTPLLFASGRLVVFVEAAAWGHEIRHRAPGLLDDLGRHGISARTITVKMHPPSPPPPPRKPRARLRLSPHSARHIAQLAESIEHPPLARALISLAKRASGKAEAETSEGGGNEHAPGASPAPHTSATVRTKAIGSSASSS